jgi:CheY-like chemotaxis protein
MLNILIADQIKSSLVMSSEIFKDKVPGCMVLVAESGQRVLEMVRDQRFDMVVIDFDLPDVDGVTLAHALREIYPGPVLLTAYPDKTAAEAIDKELFAYDDLSGWLAKPVKFEALAEKIDKFITNKARLTKRFETDIDTMLVGKGEGRGKRAPKVNGNIVKLSVNGALVKLDETIKMKIGDEITLSMDFPEDEILDVSPQGTTKLPKGSGKSSGKKITPTIKTKASKVKATVAWVNKGKTEAGLHFCDLSDSQKKKLEWVIRSQSV